VFKTQAQRNTAGRQHLHVRHCTQEPGQWHCDFHNLLEIVEDQ
jgi:hypothetical protein